MAPVLFSVCFPRTRHVPTAVRSPHVSRTEAYTALYGVIRVFRNKHHLTTSLRRQHPLCTECADPHTIHIRSSHRLDRMIEHVTSPR